MMLSADMIWRSNFTNGASGRPSCMEATNIQSTSCPQSRDMGMVGYKFTYINIQKLLGVNEDITAIACFYFDILLNKKEI